MSFTLRPEIVAQPRIPLPMHGVNPRTVLGVNWWNRERRRAFRSTNYHCVACGVHKFDSRYRAQLDGHESYEIDYLLGTMTYVECVPLCYPCHNFIHSGRLRILLEKRQITHSRYAGIIKHGNEILRANNLEIPEAPPLSETADWEDWRLVIGDEEFPPLFESYEDWKIHYGIS